MIFFHRVPTKPLIPWKQEGFHHPKPARISTKVQFNTHWVIPKIQHKQDGFFAMNIHLHLNLGSGKNTALEHGGKSWESYFEFANNAHHEQHFLFFCLF